MTTVVKRYPTFELELITENTTYELTYDTKTQLKQADFEEALISFSIKNSMQDDSPVFSLVILAKDKWDTIVNSNDLIRIKVIPDVTKGVPDNPYIMVGLISDVRRDGEYSNGSIYYRITGRAMTKALIDFEVGVIQEVATITPTMEWLPDGTEKGLKFSANTAAGIGNEIVERFVYKYAEYSFSNNKGLKDYFTHSFSSWEEDESLGDVTPFVNYEGSLRQFLEDVAAKPFNELFFEYTNDGTCVAMMRPTPFDQDKWKELPSYKFTSDVVVEESFGKSDAEMFSVFVVQAPNLVEFNSLDIGVFPKFHPDLVRKYGYKRLDAQNRYLLSGTVANAQPNNTAADGSNDGSTGQDGTGQDGTGQDGNTNGNQGVTAQTNPTDPNNPNPTDQPLQPQNLAPTFTELLPYLNDNKFFDAENLRKNRNKLLTDLKTKFPNMTEPTANAVLDAIKDGNLDADKYNKILETTGNAQDQQLATDKGASGEKLERYTERLFNWYCENVNFYNGDIRIIGDPTYRLGIKLFYEDAERDTTWEFYLESVQHEFSFTNGYTTVLGVTRGLPDNGAKRFSNLWGKSEDFKGGYLGESSLQDLVDNAKAAAATQGNTGGGGAASGTWGGGQGSGGAMGALSTARQMTQRASKYVFGGGRGGTNIFLANPIIGDCSSFIWWIFQLNGITLKGGATGMNTDTIKVDPQLKVISPRGSSKQAAMGMLQLGDIVYFDTYKVDGHIGIYSGNGHFIGFQTKKGISEANFSSGYYWNKFNGHVLRL
ncbi:tail lysin [Bacillus phage Mater]|uniref:Tail lysin n=1 Tax=Bacillus phage Mater TaxID=1540090 RepID=A0A0A0RS48_9CAUD|nr:tail protein with lysin activity [Bacillus phage Mater]AIW03321.1 tail lysin [Bacillus phage Mater]